MFVFNPPWTLNQALRDSLPWLTDVLAVDTKATWELLESAGTGAQTSA
jgi:23S rRNA A2030 N6-methylase RlmJ